ncbi:MAG: TRAP transporter permease [Pseudomonadota bacterium]
MVTNPDQTAPESSARSADAAAEMAAAADAGGRHPRGWQAGLIPVTCFIWAVFQIFYSSNVPFWMADVFGVNIILNNTEIRLFHLSFALFLTAVAFPLFRSSPKNYVPWYDWVLGIVGIVCCLYLFVFKNEIAVRAGLPTTPDLIASAVGLVILGVAVYRSLGLPLLIVASVFLGYTFFGSAEWLPDVIQWKGASFGKAMWHYWMQTEGVFGVALGVSAQMIFLFVLFGSILEKAGAGNYFIQISFAALGHLRGGPAKAAVCASAMSGLYSGSSIANVVTTGTFTIPLMKRTGFKPEKAGAVEVASSTNGQLTPPVMGAAAFLMAEFTGVAYTDIIVHALVPALVSYIALIYIVHLEALKLGLKGLDRPPAVLSLARRLIGFLTGFIVIAILTGLVYFGLGWVKVALPEWSFLVAVAACVVAYLVLLMRASRHPDLEIDDPNKSDSVLPYFADVAITGLYFILPIVILIWCIIIERLSPTLSAFWATMAMTAVALTQHPLKAMMRGEVSQLGSATWRGVGEWVDGMIAGSRNMIAIAVATGIAGVIVGTVSLTGMHQIISEFVEYLSGGSLMLMLLLVAGMSLILGMGLPTTANYIVVSTLMAPVIVTLGAKSGLIIPLIAAHLFVFYFGILADDTPPVGLAAFAASAISGGDPIKTGVQGFMYDIRTALLPFLFIFNTELLLIDVSAAKAFFVFGVAVMAMMLFAAATQGYFLAPNRWWETAALLLIAFTLFRPGYWLDQVSPRYASSPGTAFVQVIDEAKPGDKLRLEVSGPNADNPDRMERTTLVVTVPDKPAGGARLQALGLLVANEGDVAKLDEPLPTSSFAKIGQQFDFYGDNPVQIAELRQERSRYPKEFFYLPALLLLGIVILFQRRRQTQPAF